MYIFKMYIEEVDEKLVTLILNKMKEKPTKVTWWIGELYNPPL